MKQFLSFVRKEFYHILRDKRTVLILLGMPIVQIILFGFAISTEVKNARIAVLDSSKDLMTSQIVQKLGASEYFTIVDDFHIPEQIEPAFQKGEIDMVVVFEDHFIKNLQRTGRADIQLITDASDPNTATMVANYATNIIAMYQQEQMMFSGSSIQIVPQLKLLYNPGMKGAYNFVPGVMGLILMLICAMMTSIAIVREKERGTMEILLVSPLKPIFIILAKAVPYFTLSCVNLCTILLLSVYVLGVPVAGSIFWLAVLSLIFILVSLSLGLLISTIVKTQVAAMLASGMVLMMPVMLLSGMMFPIESMPWPLQWLSNIIPARWYIVSVKKIMIEGLDISFAYNELFILSAMAVLLMAVSLRKFKNRLE